MTIEEHERQDPVLTQILTEQNQAATTRRPILAELEKELGRPVVSFFTSFFYPVGIEDEDADMLEGILQMLDLSAGLVLVINSPGGSGLAAERIINVCRSYSGTDEFWAVVPNKAKSAATMVCLEASKIYMGTSSELGPIDPQISFIEDGVPKRFSVHNLVQSYTDLFERAIQETGERERYKRPATYSLIFSSWPTTMREIFRSIGRRLICRKISRSGLLPRG